MWFTKSFILSLAALAVAHPGHEEEEHRQALAARSERIQTKRALDNCAASLKARGVYSQAVERRKAELAKLRIAKRIPVQGKLRS